MIYTNNTLNKTCPTNKITDVNVALSMVGSAYWFIPINVIFTCVYMILTKSGDYYNNQTVKFVNRPQGGAEQKEMCVQAKSTLIISSKFNLYS